MRYEAKPKCWWQEEPVYETTRQVIVEDDVPVQTGLLDQYGDPLYRVRERIPFGFVRS